jgi:hypothetical protein
MELRWLKLGTIVATLLHPHSLEHEHTPNPHPLQSLPQFPHEDSGVSTLQQPPDFKKTWFDADMAVSGLLEEVEFSRFFFFANAEQMHSPPN